MPGFLKGQRLAETLGEQTFQPRQNAPVDDQVVVLDADEEERRRLAAANGPRQYDPMERSIYDTDYANYPAGHPMREAYEAERRQAMGMIQKLMAAYQAMRNRR